MTSVVCKYKCQRCGVFFEKEKPGPVVCPVCEHIYIDWLNHIEILKSIGRWA